MLRVHRNANAWFVLAHAHYAERLRDMIVSRWQGDLPARDVVRGQHVTHTD
jgi:hypothetical protein